MSVTWNYKSSHVASSLTETCIIFIRPHLLFILHENNLSTDVFQNTFSLLKSCLRGEVTPDQIKVGQISYIYCNFSCVCPHPTKNGVRNRKKGCPQHVP